MIGCLFLLIIGIYLFPFVSRPCIPFLCRLGLYAPSGRPGRPLCQPDGNCKSADRKNGQSTRPSLSAVMAARRDVTAFQGVASGRGSARKKAP